MPEKPKVTVFWFRRDLRLEDNAGLFYALQTGYPVLPLFIFDTSILDKLPDKDDGRVTFIHQAIHELNGQLLPYKSSVYVKHASVISVWMNLLDEFDVQKVYTNNDYEPYARDRDHKVEQLLKARNISFYSCKDHLIFEKSEIIKSDNSPYTVFSPYKRRWLEAFQPGIQLKPFESAKLLDHLYPGMFKTPHLEVLGFTKSALSLPDKRFKEKLPDYAALRDYPSIEGTTRLGIHLRFGTISIREVVAEALRSSEVWLSELIWREFYSMILWHFPDTVNQSFKKDFDNINWRNDEAEFLAWTEGMTGYPLVDAGMRELNSTGFMHNRVRMVVASFLCKHLLIDWRWGAAYFAQKLLDYEMASNIGGWQWAAGTGNDAAPYFRIFNPTLQLKKFDSKLEYVKKWVPEYGDPFQYPQPVVNHEFARTRALQAYKAALKT